MIQQKNFDLIGLNSTLPRLCVDELKCRTSQYYVEILVSKLLFNFYSVDIYLFCLREYFVEDEFSENKKLSLRIISKNRPQLLQIICK